MQYYHYATFFPRIIAAFVSFNTKFQPIHSSTFSFDFEYLHVFLDIFFGDFAILLSTEMQYFHYFST